MHLEFWNWSEQSGSVLACRVSAKLSRLSLNQIDVKGQLLAATEIRQWRLPAERKLSYCSLCYLKTTKYLRAVNQFQTTEGTVEKASSSFLFAYILNRAWFLIIQFDLNILEQGFSTMAL